MTAAVRLTETDTPFSLDLPPEEPNFLNRTVSFLTRDNPKVTKIAYYATMIITALCLGYAIAAEAIFPMFSLFSGATVLSPVDYKLQKAYDIILLKELAEPVQEIQDRNFWHHLRENRIVKGMEYSNHPFFAIKVETDDVTYIDYVARESETWTLTSGLTNEDKILSSGDVQKLLKPN